MFVEQQIGRLVEWRRQVQAVEEALHALDRQQHQIVHRQSGQRVERGVVELTPSGR